MQNQDQKSDQDYFTYWHQERLRRKLIAQQYIDQARATLPQLKKILVDQFQVTKIILFGSLVRGNFDPESDLDLAVAGLAPQDFFRAYMILNDHSPFPIDLKPLESLHPSFRAKVERMGECLYAKHFSSHDR
jgi:predicted nucleotidyltransferase